MEKQQVKEQQVKEYETAFGTFSESEMASMIEDSRKMKAVKQRQREQTAKDRILIEMARAAGFTVDKEKIAEYIEKHYR